MVDQHREDAIRERAYHLWEQSGGGDGSHEEHWRQAEAEYDGIGPRVAEPAPPMSVASPHSDGVSLLPPQDEAGRTGPLTL